MSSVREKDWKKLRAMKDQLLNVACERILEQIDTVMKKHGNNSHEVYLEIWKILEQKDKEIAEMFDDLRRSNAVYKLAAWQRNELLADDELAEFSDETQKIIRALNRYRR